MKDILDRIADSSPNESSHELICRLRDCAREIEALRAIAKQAPAVEAGVPAIKTPDVILTGAQLLEALDFIAPDRTTDPEQLESEVAIQYGEGHSGKAHYVWCAEYPEEGSFVLDGSSARAPEAAAEETVPAGWRLVPVEPTVEMKIAGDNAGFWCGDKWRAMIDAAPQPASEQQRASFQSRVRPWMLECFGAEISADRAERNHRFFEEAAELVQACGMTASEAHQLVDYTWSRPVGEPNQEAGGVMVTLAALCLANGLDMHAAGETELARINKPDMVIRIRAKQAAKPKHSPLPEATKGPCEQLTCDVVREMPRFEAAIRGAFDYTPKRNPFAEVVPHAEEAYHFGRDCDRFMGWCMSVQTHQHMSGAVLDVLAERRRVVDQEGFTPEHDDEHDEGELASAACAYALAAADRLNPHSQGDGDYGSGNPPQMWPRNWAKTWWKPTTSRNDLVKAAQLTIAEIERIDRAAAKEKQG